MPFLSTHWITILLVSISCAMTFAWTSTSYYKKGLDANARECADTIKKLTDAQSEQNTKINDKTSSIEDKAAVMQDKDVKTQSEQVKESETIKNRYIQTVRVPTVTPTGEVQVKPAPVILTEKEVSTINALVDNWNRKSKD